MSAVVLVAIFCGCLAAIKGNRTAWFLLASTAFTSALSLMGMEFNAFFWMLIDLAVVMAIAGAQMTRCDALIIALFVPAWASYSLDSGSMYYISSAVVTAQFLLLFPVPQIWGGCSKRLTRSAPPDAMEMARA